MANSHKNTCSATLSWGILPASTSIRALSYYYIREHLNLRRITLENLKCGSPAIFFLRNLYYPATFP